MRADRSQKKFVLHPLRIFRWGLIDPLEKLSQNQGDLVGSVFARG